MFGSIVFNIELLKWHPPQGLFVLLLCCFALKLLTNLNSFHFWSITILLVYFHPFKFFYGNIILVFWFLPTTSGTRPWYNVNKHWHTVSCVIAAIYLRTETQNQCDWMSDKREIPTLVYVTNQLWALCICMQPSYDIALNNAYSMLIHTFSMG
jgi:hypothetical protein